MIYDVAGSRVYLKQMWIARIKGSRFGFKPTSIVG
jgi:hypothetical protein